MSLHGVTAVLYISYFHHAKFQSVLISDSGRSHNVCTANNNDTFYSIHFTFTLHYWQTVFITWNPFKMFLCLENLCGFRGDVFANNNMRVREREDAQTHLCIKGSYFVGLDLNIHSHNSQRS